MQPYTFPPYLQIETVRKCNARCPYCPVGTHETDLIGAMPEELYAKIESEIIAHSHEIKRVTLNLLGEPLLDKDIAGRIARLKHGGVTEVALITNGQLLDDAIGRLLLQSGLDMLRISMDAVDKQLYEELKPGLNFETVVGNIQNYIKLRDSLRPASHICLSMVKSLQISDAHIDAYITFWKRYLLQQGTIKIVSLHSFCDNVSALHLEVPELTEPCDGLIQIFNIRPDGLVPLCCVDANLNIVQGNITTESIQNVWVNSQNVRLRELHYAGERAKIPMRKNCDAWDANIRTNIAI